MSKERLLKRIRNWSNIEGETPDFGEPDLATFSESLLDDISKIYNTRRGTVMLGGDFGIPDFTDLMNTMSPPVLENLTRDFVMVTNTYEPRLRNVVVRYQPRESDMDLIRFSVTAMVVFRDSPVAINYHILLQGDGSVALQVQE